MKSDNRRYFRIQDTISLSYRRLDQAKAEDAPTHVADLLTLLDDQGRVTKQLALELKDASPKVTELLAQLRRDREQMLAQLSSDHELVMRLARRSREVSISACGVGFINELPIDAGAKLQLSLELTPKKPPVATKGVLVGCEPTSNGRYYWRIDFYDMQAVAQEVLIQHIVQRQSAQLKASRD